MSRKCKVCSKPLPKYKDCTDIYQKNNFCDVACLSAHGREKAQKARERKAEREAKAKRAKHRDDKKRVNRTARLSALQDLINQYVVHIRDVNEPCCTCGTTNPGIKYDAGHCFTRGARSDLRYELTNIHKQCSVNCNQFASGDKGAHKEFIANRYGADHLAKLEDHTQWPSLKERFPDWQSIEAEIAKWRAVIREHGLKPKW